MKKRKWLLVLLLCAAILPLFFWGDMFSAPQPPAPHTISLVVRGQNSSWDTIRSGAELACEENNLILNYIELSEENDARQQASLIQRELEGGIDALLLAAAAPGVLEQIPATLLQDVALVYVESAAESPALTTIRPQDETMGRDIAEKLLGDSAPQTVYLVGAGQGSATAARREGVEQVLAAAGVQSEYREVPAARDAEVFTLQLQRNRVEAVIALDAGCLEALGRIFSEMDAPPALYGIGATVRIVYFLENDIVNATVAYNDFAIGYLGAASAAAAIGHTAVESEQHIAHELVTLENIFDADKQQLIFEVR